MAIYNIYKIKMSINNCTITNSNIINNLSVAENLIQPKLLKIFLIRYKLKFVLYIQQISIKDILKILLTLVGQYQFYCENIGLHNLTVLVIFVLIKGNMRIDTPIWLPFLYYYQDISS